MEGKPMRALSLKDRVAALEAELSRLKEKVENTAGPGRPWWDEIAGTFANDPIYEEAMRLGRKYRRSRRRAVSGD
jgi:hypothetical protein